MKDLNINIELNKLLKVVLKLGEAPRIQQVWILMMKYGLMNIQTIFIILNK